MVSTNRQHATSPSCRRLSARLIVAMLLLAGCTQGEPLPAADTTVTRSPQENARESAASQWPLFRGNAQATGLATVTLPEKPELVWTFSIDRGGFEASAVIADGMVFVGSTTGTFYAVELASGKKKWEHKTESGFTASAAVHQGRVYVGDMDGRFYCFEAATGKLAWTFDAESEVNSSPNFHGGHVLFGSQDSMLYCLDAKSGQLVWKYESPDQIRCSPTIVNDRTFVAGCDGRLHIIDLATGKQTADVVLEGPTGCTPAVVGEAVYVGTEGRAFLAVDWKQAKLLWRYENHKHGASIRSSAAVTSELVIFGSRDKQVHALEAKTGQQRWAFTTRGPVDSSPVIVGSRVFVGSGDGRLYALDLATGKPVWQFEAGGHLSSSPAVAAERLVIGSEDGNLYCFGKKGGKDEGLRTKD